MAPRHSHYDMIFLGGGCATLSLLTRLLASQRFSDCRFLVIEQDDKKKNDRTWCFWEKGTGYFESVVHKQWEQLDFMSTDYAAPLAMNGYRYKMIRGVDFYDHCLGLLDRSGQVEWINATLEDHTRSDQHITLTCKEGPVWELTAPLVFNSIYRPSGTAKGVHLLQHFKGWVVELPAHNNDGNGNYGFDPNKATLMDFRVGQQAGTTFVYVMPFSERKALVEYTLFTEKLLKPEAYEEGLRNYLEQQLGIRQYKVLEEEFGVIPMTTHRFSFLESGVFNLGTAGGQTKASSGYTFQFIQKQSESIIALLENADRTRWQTKLAGSKGHAARFNFYDRVLLHVLARGYAPGDQVFSRLFERNDADRIFRFLDNESQLSEELAIISGLPTLPFLRGAFAAF